MLQHPPLAYDVPHALRPYHLIFPDIFQRKRQARVLSLHYSDFAKGTLADNAQQAEVVEIHLVGEDDGLAIGVAHLRRRGGALETGRSRGDLVGAGSSIRGARRLPQRHCPPSAKGLAVAVVGPVIFGGVLDARWRSRCILDATHEVVKRGGGARQEVGTGAGDSPR